jgi:hypothetical protein
MFFELPLDSLARWILLRGWAARKSSSESVFLHLERKVRNRTLTG